MKCSIVICIVIPNTIFEAQRCIGALLKIYDVTFVKVKRAKIVQGQKSLTVVRQQVFASCCALPNH